MAEPSTTLSILGRNKSAKAFRQVRQDMNQLKGVARSLIGPLGAAFSVIGLQRFASNTLTLADEIGKLSARTGVATGVLQELEFAFDLAGVGQEQLNKGLLTFGKRVGRAEGGAGALAEGLKKIDPALLKTINSTNNQTEALEVVFDAMANARTEAERLAIADAAFGEAGLKMTAAFEDGAVAFDKARERARELGIVIDDDLIQGAEQLNDDMNVASRAIGIQFKNAFLSLAPAISSTLNVLTDFLTEAREADKIMDRFGQTLPDRLVIMQDEAAELDERIRLLQEQIKRSQSDPIFGGILGLQGALEDLKKLEEERRGLAKKITLLKEILATQKGITGETKKTKDVVINMTKETDAGREAAKNFTDEIKDVAEVARRMGSDPIPMMDPKGINAATLALEPFTNNIKKMMDLVDDLNKRFDIEANFEKRVKQLQHLRNIEAISPRVFDRAMEEAIQNAGSHFGGFVEDFEDGSEDIQRIALSVQGVLESGFTRTFDQIIKGGLEMRDVMSMILGDIASAIFRAGVAQPIAGAITSGITGAFSGGGGLDLVPQFAGGGSPPVGRASLVGERGPELFVPKQAGMIVPNHALGGGGVTIQQNITVDARGSNDPASVEAAASRGIARAAPQIVNAAVEAVRDGRRRNPKFFGGRA